MRSFSIRSGKAQLTGVEDGTGPAIVFLHAGVADKRMWRDQMAAFTDRYRVVTYDRRGFGESRYEAETFSHTQDLRAVLDGLGIERACLVGCSQGGRFAVDFALAYPKRVTKLVLVAPAIGGAPQPKLEDLPPDIDDLLQQAEQAQDQQHFELVNQIEAHMWLDGPRAVDGRVQGSARDLFLRMNIIVLKNPSPGKDTPATDSFKRLKEIGAPTLLIWGDLDFPHLQKRCVLLGKRIKGAKSALMPGTAHLPNLEQPKQFNALLEEFLKDAA
ncbi:alpha/beta fold hydrolase [Dongia deserti]|uniref:alpha/beta fold hydrolase n=1 Tax=Dongia deserti TaxID=2268030 RepID=UPI0013C431E3|nr:alpha/beta hydrolase [Dongia deserti]